MTIKIIVMAAIESIGGRLLYYAKKLGLVEKSFHEKAGEYAYEESLEKEETPSVTASA